MNHKKRNNSRLFISSLIFTFLIVSLIAIFTGTMKNLPTRNFAPTPTHATTLIDKENQAVGTTSWKSDILKRNPAYYNEENYIRSLKGTSGVAATNSDPNWTNNSAIYGYTDQTSINKGQSIQLKVSTTRTSYKIEIYRMGWYGGTGGRLITTVSNIKGVNRTIPSPNTTTGLLSLNWPTAYTLQTDASWISGVYLAKLTTVNNDVGYSIFVLRDDNTVADILYEVPLTTYQAYNNWGGKSLYDYNSNNARAYKVSFNRPYANWSGAGGFFDGDYNMIRWLESQGYNVTYITSTDLQSNPNIMNGRKVFLSNYHDEYWSKQMRATATSARDQGKSLAFFDANSIYWQIRFENSSIGIPNRTIVCYKEDWRDPMGTVSTVQWRNSPVNQPENALLGEMYESDYAWGSSFPWIVKNSSNWIYNGTSLQDGQSIPDLVGYEYDKVYDNGQTPGGLQILSDSPVVDGHGVSSKSNSTLYTALSGGLVFDAGTIYWPWKLDDNEYTSRGADARVQRMTNNILQTMITNIPHPVTPTPIPSNTPTITSSPSLSITPTITTAQSNLFTVYDESLATGWQDWSWNSTNNFSDTTKPFSGIKNISWKQNAGYAGLYLHTTIPVSSASYSSFTFAIQATQAGAKLGVQLYGDQNQGLGTMVNLAEYGGDPIVGSYKVYTIPLSALSAQNVNITGMHIMDVTGTVQPVMYVDTIGFSATATPTPTSVVYISPTPSPTAITVYSDTLATGWENWSWDDTIDFSNTTPVYSGLKSISYTATAAWSGIDFHNSAGINTTEFTTLHFAAQASQAGQSYGVFLDDSAGNHLKYPLPLSQYGGNPIPGTWKIYEIPLSDLNASNIIIKDIVIHEILGKPQPALFIDEVTVK